MTQQFQKNPNGGYLKASSHGEGRETAVLELSPDLINELYRQSQQFGKGYLRLNASELKAGRYGNYRRVTVPGALTDQQIQNHLNARSNAQAAAPVQQPVQQAAPVQPPAPEAAQPVPQAAPVQTPAAVGTPVPTAPVQQTVPVQQQAAPAAIVFEEDEISF